MSHRRERGVALLAAVGTLAVLTVLAVGLAETAAVDQRQTTSALGALQAEALARSGVAVAAVVLDETRAAGAPDTLASPWGRDTGRQPLGAGWVHVRVEDAARRLDLNAPELAYALPRLLGLLDLDPGLADVIADWIDDDDAPRPRGAERAWYLGGTPAVVPRNAPFATVGELALVRGIDTSALARLRLHVTVAGEHHVNPNTASREVLLAVVQDAGTVERLLAARARGPITDDQIRALLDGAPPAVRQALVARGQCYTVRAVAGVGDVRRAVEATLFAPEGAQPEVIAWRPSRPGALPE